MKSGQTIVMLLVFMAVAITITTASVILSISNSQTNTRLQSSNEALAIAESGMENALIRLLRDPSYIGETNLPVGDGKVTINITNSGTCPVGQQNPTLITSTGVLGSYTRTVQAFGCFAGVIFNISSWQQIY